MYWEQADRKPQSIIDKKDTFWAKQKMSFLSFISVLVGKFIQATDFFTDLVRIFSYFRIDKFGIHLC